MDKKMDYANNHAVTQAALRDMTTRLSRYTIFMDPYITEVKVTGKRARLYEIKLTALVESGLKENVGLIGEMRKHGYKATRCRIRDGYGFRLSVVVTFTESPSTV